MMYCSRAPIQLFAKTKRSILQRTLTQARSMSNSTSDNLALLYTKWTNKPIYIDLLKERGVPVVDADCIAEEDWQKVTFATVWNPPSGLLAKCSNLRVVMSLGAGVDSLLAPGQVPQQLPIARIVDPLMAQRMATWVVWGVVNYQRKMDKYLAAQRSCRWDLTIEARSSRDNCEVSVGVMGLGVMGQAAAKQLCGMGYKVSGWSRTTSTHKECQQAGVTCYAGAELLEAFVRAQDVLVCLLPLTDETQGIINHQLLSWLQPGSAVINGGRGKQLIEADLLDALDSGQVGFALLDVFDPEPLPPSSRLWQHPKVRLTPHVASMTTMETAADQIAANYHRVAAGKGPLQINLVGRGRGY